MIIRCSIAYVILLGGLFGVAQSRCTDEVSCTRAFGFTSDEINGALERIGAITYEYITVYNQLTQPIMVRLEAINFCDIDPKETHGVSLQLPYKPLTSDLGIIPLGTIQLRYLYNVQPHASRKEFLLMYPRLYVTDGTHANCFRVENVERKCVLTHSYYFDKQQEQLKHVTCTTSYGERPMDNDEPRGIRTFHFLQYAWNREKEFGKIFLTKSLTHFGDSEFVASPLVDRTDHESIIHTGKLTLQS